MPDPLPFGAATRAWFEGAFSGPTPVQTAGWSAIAQGAHTLLSAPTGSGKTLAAFLASLDRLLRPGSTAGVPGVRVVYVSPLKSLAYDVERNLAMPLAGIQRAAAGLGVELPPIRPVVRTGDTPPRERRRLLRDPGEILITTPESLYLLLGSRARETLRTVDTIIVDEIHALAPTKRGIHLALSLERLAALTGRDPQRIGLSATQRPLEEIARFLGGDRPVKIVDASAPPPVDLILEMPETTPIVEGGERTIWPAIDQRVLELVRAHKTTIVFTNSRRLCERLAERLNALAGETLVRAHHGSVARAQRLEIEELLKAGKLPGIVATSSMELGIDMGSVDLVVQIESPGAVSRGLQRVGRAGHQVGARSAGRIFAKHRSDLLEAAVVTRGMREGAVEETRVPRHALDVLAQQLVAITAEREHSAAELWALVRRAYSFRQLPRAHFDGVLDLLAGKYPEADFPELRPRVVWDRARDMVLARKDARAVALINGGTIPDRGLYGVYLGEDGPRIGELDEEMVHESRAGQTFVLGATSWRILEITRDRVIVRPAPGEPGRMPFWRGEGPGRPVEVGRRLGAFVRELGERAQPDALAWLERDFGLEPRTAGELWSYIDEQRTATGTLPTDRAITVERFRDELGDWRICILTPFGARVHAPWALALEAAAGSELQAIWSDDGIALRFEGAPLRFAPHSAKPRGAPPPGDDALADTPAPRVPVVPDPEKVEELVLTELGRSAIFATHFRENAARALLLPRRRPGARTPLWLQRLRAHRLLEVAQKHPQFPILLETYREVLSDVFDLPSLVELLARVRRGEIQVVEVETQAASPFAQSLAFAYVQAFLYEGDAPVAERRAQALTLDRNLLAELLGRDELSDLIEPALLVEIEDELQQRTPERRARHADALSDLLRRVGDLSPAEIAERAEGDHLGELAQSGRAVPVTIAGEERWIAVEDAGRVRDGLGVRLPAGIPPVFLAPIPEPLISLVARWARTHGPFAAQAASARFGVAALPALTALVAAGKLVRLGERYVDAEVLKLVRRRTLARLRNEVAPVPAKVLARFVPRWQGVIPVGETRPPGRLVHAILPFEGLALPFSDLERAILPARVPDLQPRQLDELGALGEIVWIGRGALGGGDGRIALYRRSHVALLAPPAEIPPELGEVARKLLDHLEGRGASFFAELVNAAGALAHDVLAGLWELVWAGLVTNDTFQPLRALDRPRPPPGRAGSISAAIAGGRWSAVRKLLAAPVTDTERLAAQAQAMLERYGIVTREAGDFGTLAPVLRAMEEAGKIRRGYFVEGLGGVQYAHAAAVDRLRAERGDAEGPVMLLAATDPANPYGVLVPWPEPSLRRIAGARVILVGGQAVLYVEPGGRRLRILDPELVAAAAPGLDALARRKRHRRLKIDKVNGEPVLRSPFADALERAGFRVEPGGLVLEIAG